MNEQEKKPDWSTWRKVILENPRNFGTIAASLAGGLIMAVAVGLKHGAFAGWLTLGILLMGTLRRFREIAVAAVLLGLSYFGFSRILSETVGNAHFEKEKAFVIVPVVLLWSGLVALCLRRYQASHDSE